MMRVLETIAVAFSTYSALPVPRVEWNENNMRYALCAFPLVGAAQGLAWWGACALCAALGLPALLRGALLCALPTLITGGIHLDGYADVSDALASHAPPERKREILRDPRIGAFAAIRLCVYFVAYFALCCAFEPTGAALWRMGCGFVLSRAISGGLLTALPIAEGSSLARTFADAADKRRVWGVLAVELILCVGAASAPEGRSIAAAMFGVLLAVSLRCIHTVRREFGGISGDLAGWFLVKAEFWMLAAMVAARHLSETML